jgi:hypothetical protein
MELSRDDHMKDYAKSIVQGQPYERLCKISHIPVPLKFLVTGIKIM